jgi:predicted GIY-YIG superfamily endonuclease
MKTAAHTKTRPKKPRKSYRLYALSLRHGKYYVGLTAYKDVMLRFNEHLVGKTVRGAKWTSLHKPVAIIEVRELGAIHRKTAERSETLMTMEYIRKYGLAHVRGGRLCAVSSTMHAYWYDKTKGTYTRRTTRAR